MNNNFDEGYNLGNLEREFKEYLVAGIEKSGKVFTKSTIKNYLSDLRHFNGWLQSNLNQYYSLGEHSSFPIDNRTIFLYREYLLQNDLPLKTINRRLSTIRKFCLFAEEKGYVDENLAAGIKNVSIGPIGPISPISPIGPIFDADIQEFLTIINSHGSDL